MSKSKISDLHNHAMALAAEAEAARRAGDETAALSLFADALEHERKAAQMARPSLEPTRSILFRSAASLALDCGKHLEAEQLIGLGLAGNAPAEIRDELRDLYETINFHRHLDVRGVRLRPAEFQLSLAGDAVAYGLVPADEYIPRIQTMENLLVRTAERKRGIPFRERGKPARSIIEDLSLFMSAERAASFAVTIRLGGPVEQKQLFDAPEVVVDEFLECMKLFGSDKRDELGERISDSAYYRNFVQQARKIAPDGERIRTVGFTSEQVRVAIRGVPSTKWYARPVSRQQLAEIAGTLTKAETQAKKNIIGIRDDSGKVHTVHVPKGLMSDIVRPLWERRVVLTGQRRYGVITLLEIQPDDDEA